MPALPGPSFVSRAPALAFREACHKTLGRTLKWIRLSLAGLQMRHDTTRLSYRHQQCLFTITSGSPITSDSPILSSQVLNVRHKPLDQTQH